MRPRACVRPCVRSHPFVYFPAFYSLKGYVEGRPLEETYRKYREDLWENCKALWMIWVPAQMVNFTVVPLHLRIPFGEPECSMTAAWLACVGDARWVWGARHQLRHSEMCWQEGAACGVPTRTRAG